MNPEHYCYMAITAASLVLFLAILLIRWVVTLLREAHDRERETLLILAQYGINGLPPERKEGAT